MPIFKPGSEPPVQLKKHTPLHPKPFMDRNKLKEAKSKPVMTERDEVMALPDSPAGLAKAKKLAK